jgi:IclR family transcriptional regulator, acetate operon repressor
VTKLAFEPRLGERPGTRLAQATAPPLRFGKNAPAVQALNRLASILDLVSARGEPQGAADIAQATGLPLSTVARLMRQLAEEDLLYRSSIDGRYSLGPRIFALASAGLSRLDIADVARPVLQRLRDATGETTALHVRRGLQRVCIDEAQSHHQVRRVVPRGLTQDLPGSATGEVLLAYAPQAELESAMRRARLSQGDRQQLDRRLEEIRANGYALREDPTEGITGISAPVRKGMDALAAVSIAGPTSRFDRDAALRHSGTLLEAVEDLAKSL